MSSQQFFQTHPVFRRDEFVEHVERGGNSANQSTVGNLLAHHRQKGRIVKIRRGLYASVPAGLEPEDFQPNRYLIGAHLWADGVLGYHTALELHGYAHSSFETVHILCPVPRRDFEYRGTRFHPILQPKPLRENGQTQVATEDVAKSDDRISVTRIERTIVDCLSRPELAGGWEELFKSIDNVPYVDCELLEDYVELLDNRTTVAKLGFLLEAKHDDWFVPDGLLERLETLVPASPVYIDEQRSSSLASRWQLMVPDDILNRSWEEM